MLPTLEAHSVDLICADLPYGTTACKWDSVIPLDKLWPEYRRVLKPRGAVVLTASQPFTSALVMSNPTWFRYELIWEKSNPTGFLDAKRKPLKAHESILVFYRRQPTYNPQKWQVAPCFVDRRKVFNGSDPRSPIYHAKLDDRPRKVDDGTRYPVSVISIPSVWQQEMHPTQKPLALLEYLIRTYSNPGDVVLDNAFGSCTTGEAAIKLERAFIGMERDAGYFAIGQARCAKAQAAYQPILEGML